MITRFERFSYDLTEIDLYWHRITSEVMKKYGIKGSAGIYFLYLRENADGITAADLGSKCGRDKADVSRDMKALEAAGMVCRIAQGDNKYRAKLFLTPRGNEVAKELVHTAEKVVDAVGGEFTEQDREIFYKVLDRITQNLGEFGKKGLQ